VIKGLKEKVGLALVFVDIVFTQLYAKAILQNDAQGDT
jgi:hypothetical protein